MDTVAFELGATSVADPLRVLAFPGVIRQEESDFAPLVAAAKKLFDQALEDFTQTRAREGARLADYIRERCDALEVLVAKVRERYPTVREGLRA